MSWLHFQRNELSYSETYQDETIYRHAHTNRAIKPKPKPVKPQKKQTNKRDANLEKIELYACKICQKKYTSKASYSRHYSTVHESGKGMQVIKKKPATVAVRAR